MQYNKVEICGVNTSKLKVLNEKVDASSGTKVELDALNILDNTITLPEKVEVSTVSGLQRSEKKALYRCRQK